MFSKMRSFFSETLALSAGAAACFASPAAAAPGTAELAHPIDAVLPGNVNFLNSTAYTDENVYWSNRQSDVHPLCFVTPRRTSDVSIILKTLTALRAPFTVKSGGHTPFVSSNIDDGVTIDLVRLNEITVSRDRATVSVGPGNRWIDVSRALDPLGLAVVGGRTANVGVSGLILGGGISYFSGSYGWACDNVRNFEVVLASGRMVNASPKQNPDLYRALRGGAGSNFGIVTRFDLVAFPQGDLSTSYLLLPGFMNRTLIPPYADLGLKGSVEDHDAHGWLVFAYVKELGGFINLLSLFHATPPPEKTIPPVFEGLESLPNVIQNDTYAANISTLSVVADIAYGSRQSWWDTSVGTSADLLQETFNLWEDHALRLLRDSGGKDISPGLVFQLIPQNVLEAMQKNGGNSLGLKPRDGPLMMVQLSTVWVDQSLDGLVEQASREFIDAVEKTAKSRGLYRGFQYINYADKSQDVFLRYGEDSYARLQAAAKKWDPKGDLHGLWKGYFKVGRDA